MTTRRLAAIMFTDIVGYTALMGSDEERAYEMLRKNRGIHTELTGKFNGTLIKEMGDGMLVSFQLASDAVQCAIEIQKRTGEEPDHKLRIGIHLGDVAFEEGDIFGDGVNIASRLQSVADPGGIYISEAIQKSIRGKAGIQSKYLGKFHLKNVDYKVKTYCIQGEGLPVPASPAIAKFAGRSLKERIFRGTLSLVLIALFLSVVWWVRKESYPDNLEISSLVILPFDNFTGNDDYEYFVSGMHASLIGDIGQIGALRVTGKTTANSFKGTNMSVPQIASELNVDGAIEGTISCLGGDSICIQIRLISAFPEEQQIWVQDFMVAKDQILNFYNNVTKKISEELNIVLSPQEESQLAEARTVDPEAYDAYLMGQFYWEKLEKESIKKAMEYFQLAIDKDPEWADPYAGLANAWDIYGGLLRVLPKSVTLPKVYEYLDKALELDPNSAQAHYVKAINAVWTKFDWEQGEKEFLKVIELNPDDALNRMYYAHLLMILCRTDEAINQANQALKLDPLKPLVLGLGGFVMSNEGDIQSATLHFEKALSINPNFEMAKVGLSNIHMGAAYADGDYEKWIELWEKKVEGGNWAWNDEGRAAVLNAFHEKGHIAAIEEMFKMNEKYGRDCFMTGIIKADRYLKLKKYDKVMDCLEKEYEERNMSISYIATNKPLYEQLKDNPRYIALLKKMNLPFGRND